MTDTLPRVSVVMCTYNGAEFIPAQLDSILAQTYPIHEIIIQDDQSTDNTPEILKEYAALDRRIKVFTVPEKRDINHNFITAIDRAQGDLIAWSDQDDVWLPEKVERLVNTLLADDLWISFHLTQPFVGDCPEKIGSFDHRTPNFGLERELFLGTVPGHTMLFRKELHSLIRNHVPDQTLDRISASFYYDAILSIVANAYGKVGIIVEPLDFHRRLIYSASGGYDSSKMQRSVLNAFRQVLRCLNPVRRRRIRPIFIRRINNLTALIDYFPKATHTGGVRRIIQSYKSPFRFVTFPYELIRNRNKVLYSREKRNSVALIRAALFAITYQDYFSSALK